ncbi:nucleoside hydrolase [Actinotalea ferrariae CF5-4]|uniref:Nucleoside hydrolase n=1 Tax=Actinotalea ferrariae CF5-4 TaxID=948458 RepID=A0A021VV60_9CELL|nr:nucleoside hydrolase [Actinotalea ferrariae]EYR65051.1 nucleoside hydrolase [Actinotalea ferrariae CF5-4]
MSAAGTPHERAAGSVAERPAHRVKMVLDCDTGVDDTLAILYAALHPAVELLGVGSVWGNVDLDTATRNCLHTVHLAGRPEVPVARGADRPLLQTDPVFAYHVHGDDGQGNAGTGRAVGAPATESAAEQMIRIAREHPGEVEIVAVGPLTNVAIALGLCPELPSLVRGITIMGGAALAPGNVTEVAEANIWCDPDAAAAVFNAAWTVTMIGLDVTMLTTLDDGHRARLDTGGTLGRYVSGILDHYIGYFAEVAFGERRSCMHDALAVAVAAGTLVPDLAPLVRAYVSTEGPTRGQTVCDLRGMYMGFPEQEGARCRPVLRTDPAFADEVVDLLIAAGDAAIPVERGSAATPVEKES